MISRRDLIKLAAAVVGAAPLFNPLLAAAGRTPVTRLIPGSGEKLPVVGMGTSRTFDAGDDPELLARLREVLQLFFDHDGALIDTSPMYGSSETVLGRLLNGVDGKQALFTATKVWTDGRENGIRQMLESLRRLQVARIDLMQIHNLRDWRRHLETLEDWKQAGRIRYIGITTSHGRAHDQLLDALSTRAFDFVQFSYNIGDREAEKRLFPLARDLGIATLINRPFQRGALFGRVKGKPLPDWAAEIDCQSWGQFFLKFVISKPEVTCVIPATSKPRHMIDNMGAGFGRLPDAETRQRMIDYLRSI